MLTVKVISKLLSPCLGCITQFFFKVSENENGTRLRNIHLSVDSNRQLKWIQTSDENQRANNQCRAMTTLYYWRTSSFHSVAFISRWQKRGLRRECCCCRQRVPTAAADGLTRRIVWSLLKVTTWKKFSTTTTKWLEKCSTQKKQKKNTKSGERLLNVLKMNIWVVTSHVDQVTRKNDRGSCPVRQMIKKFFAYVE
jgi:hypothetical protein